MKIKGIARLAWIPAFAGMTLASAADSTFTIRLLTPETALKAAQAALAKCRADGFQVAVAVVDRSGVAQVMLRDRFAGAHTVRAAADKAWTAVSFRTSTLDLGNASGPHDESSGVRHFPRVNVVGGGLTIQAAGSIVGGIGVSGAPGGKNDEACAAAGIKAISDDLEL
jgi:uncharacterized protein GlcG (DUF336 family)